MRARKPLADSGNRVRISSEIVILPCFYKVFEGFRETVCPFWKPCAGGSAGMLIFTCFPTFLKAPGKPCARTQTVCESSYIGRPRSLFMHSYKMASGKVSQISTTKMLVCLFFGHALYPECPGGKTECFLQSALPSSRRECKEVQGFLRFPGNHKILHVVQEAFPGLHHF